MLAVNEVSLDAVEDVEFDRAFEFLLKLVDLRKADELQPSAPATVYTTSVALYLLIYQRLNRNCTLEEAVKHLVESAHPLCPQNKRVRDKTLSRCTGAYSNARQRLTPETTEWLIDTVSKSIIETTTPTLNGRRIFLFDGTTVTLAPEPSLREAFPPASNQHGTGAWPVAHLAVAHELESGAAVRPEVGPMYGPEAISETELARACLTRLPENSVVLADANFGIFAMAQAIDQTGHSLLLRLTAQRFRAMVKKATLKSQHDGCTTWSLDWRPSSKDRQSHPELSAHCHLPVLLHEVPIHKDLTIWLVTTLPDSAQDCGTLYGRRGSVETDLSNLKIVLDLENIRATSVPMFHKELLTSMVAYNLVVQFRRIAAQEAKLPPRRLSFTKVWVTFRQYLLNAIELNPVQWRARFQRALTCAMRDKLPNRPGRNFKRCAYTRRPKSNHFEKRQTTPSSPTAEK